ncbi:EamA family transporter [Pengzhenrongella sicca]|uniref:EamA family transporter n=1 Tax=Pengzhenrongella sicca TaxID=2819238 RepID=A0A8A4ZF12_9MICO|nr:EamA family transporter [Pengzhenrongella sicca]QTE29599.1 EamA family transporter [Pengzhenrongella sicca]
MPTRTGPVLGRVPAPALFVVSGLTQYLGAALAVGLFSVLAAPAVAWLRVAVAAVVLVAWRRPWRTRWSRRDLAGIAAFGVVLAAMNVTFYIAIEHLPLGTAVAIEFVGPVAVAAITGRGRRERVGIALAGAGVLLLAGATVTGGGPDVVVGLIAIGLAAACWAGYILLGRRIALRGSGVTSLSMAMTAGALAFAPFLGAAAAPVLHDGRLALAIVGIAVLSSVIPYAIEQVVLRRVSAATFAVLLAMLPATAAVVGAVTLRQVPAPIDLVGLLAVSAAIALTAGSSTPGPSSGGSSSVDPAR